MSGIRFWTACILLLQARFVAPSPVQVPLLEAAAQELVIPSKIRALTGRFLHLTDLHPDKFYEAYASTEEQAACHRGTGPAGLYGAEVSDCDSPLDLINQTFKWIDANLKHDIDFVVWTGDSARHDNDEEHPRSTAEVTTSNEVLAEKMFEVFGKKEDDDDDDPTNGMIIPIIPTFGNNDILPHNIMTAGPNFWTSTYLKTWRYFIPEEQRHQFEQGGWFYKEVIPNKLAVFSLNSLYFFNSNSAVDGCALPKQPGYEQFEWLRIQLQFLRERNMKAILTGHVAPARTHVKDAWDETCWQKYALWLRQYSDVVSGSLWGHMNVDHFFLQDFEDIEDDTHEGRMSELVDVDLEDQEDDIETQVSGDYLVSLREEWSHLPQTPKRETLDLEKHLMDSSDDQRLEWDTLSSIGVEGGKKRAKKDKKARKALKKIRGPFAERFAVSMVSPSIVPNYFPAMRVYQYNITALDMNADDILKLETEGNQQHLVDSELLDPTLFDLEEGSDVDATNRKKKKHKKKNGKKKYKFIVPEPPSKSAPPGPAYSLQSLSLLGYQQWFANITRINNDFHSASTNSDSLFDTIKWRNGKHADKQPHNKNHTPDPKKFEFEIMYDTCNDSEYDMPDLTVRSFLDLAAKIGRFKPEKDSLFEAGYDDEGDEGDDDSAQSTLKKGKNRHHKNTRRKRNLPWYTFVQRAFVGTLDEDDVEKEFGH